MARPNEAAFYATASYLVCQCKARSRHAIRKVYVELDLAASPESMATREPSWFALRGTRVVGLRKASYRWAPAKPITATNASSPCSTHSRDFGGQLTAQCAHHACISYFLCVFTALRTTRVDSERLTNSDYPWLAPIVLYPCSDKVLIRAYISQVATLVLTR